LNFLLKKIVYSTLIVILVSIVAYFVLLSFFGYSYMLHVTWTVVFALFSVLISLGLFGRGCEGFENLGMIKVLFGVVVGVISVEELLLNSVFAFYGLVLSIVGLVLMPGLAVVFGGNDRWLRIALEGVALVFATRVVLSPFPLGILNLQTFLPTIYTLIIVALVLYLMYRRIPGRDLRLSAGNCSKTVQFAVGLSVGFIVGFVEYFVLKPSPILVGASFLQALAYAAIVMCVMVGISEELLFRGLMQSSLERLMPRWEAVGLASIMFGLMHIGWMNPLEVLLAYAAGVAFGYLAISTESLIAPIVAHGFGNFVLYLIVFIS